MYCDYLSKHFTDTKSCIQKCEICFEMGYLLMFKINNLANQTSHIVTEHLLIDAMTLDLPIGQTSIIKGDANSLSIAAASIVAKVTRDKMMADYDQEFPGYAFAKNAGYGTKDHLSGIDNFGVTPIHRRSFEPIKSIIKSR